MTAEQLAILADDIADMANDFIRANDPVSLRNMATNLAGMIRIHVKAAERQIAAVRAFIDSQGWRYSNCGLGVLALLDAPALDMNPTTAGTEFEGDQGKPDTGPKQCALAGALFVSSPPLPTGGVHAAGWRPIWTAPKDGVAFIAANRMDAFRAFYDLEGEVWTAEDSGLWFGQLKHIPTHWMPLPDPPVVQASEPTS